MGSPRNSNTSSSKPDSRHTLKKIGAFAYFIIPKKTEEIDDNVYHALPDESVTHAAPAPKPIQQNAIKPVQPTATLQNTVISTPPTPIQQITTNTQPQTTTQSKQKTADPEEAMKKLRTKLARKTQPTSSLSKTVSAPRKKTDPTPINSTKVDTSRLRSISNPEMCNVSTIEELLQKNDPNDHCCFKLFSPKNHPQNNVKEPSPASHSHKML